MPQRLTQKQFIEKARIKHGDKFDYALVEYKGNRTPIKIRCPTHGVFEQAPQKHIDGKHGCPKCALIARGHKLRLTKLSWISRANDVHQSKYDYSRVDYKTGRDKVEIICRDHGHFFQRAENHILLARGCPKCVGWGTDTADFIKKSKTIHGSKYDYSEVNYRKAILKVRIICPEHGAFTQTPNSHLNGAACSECGGNRKLTNETFALKARKVHGNTYDYTQVNYKNRKIKIKIICPKHGAFMQSPTDHLSGCGCSTCFGTPKKTLDQFISDSRGVHGDTYVYTESRYVTSKKRLKIICRQHGPFWQTPDNHINLKRGCPICGDLLNALRYLDDDAKEQVLKNPDLYKGMLYVIELRGGSECFWKIGIALHELEDRYYGTKLPYEYTVLLNAKMPYLRAVEIEQRVLKELKKHQYWPRKRFVGFTECFSVNPLAMDSVLSLLSNECT